jgi:O-antigen/teichoic acid export membrane protein
MTGDVLQRRPGDEISEEAAASSRRSRGVLRAGATSVLSKMITLVAGLVTLPIAIRSLEVADFGAYLIICTFVGLIALAGLGIGNGLVRQLARADGQGRPGDMQPLIASAVVIVGLASAVGVAVVLVIAAHVDLGALVGASAAGRAAHHGVVIALVLLLVDVPLSLARHVRLGLQESDITNQYIAGAGLLQIVGTAAAAVLDGGLAAFVVAFVLPLVLVDLSNSIHLYGGSRTHLRLRFRTASGATVRSLSREGSFFFCVTVAGAVAYQTDALVVARILGAEQVAQYAVPFRIFSVVPTLVGFFLTPLWPAYSEALARRDEQWARRFFILSLRYSLLLNSGAGLILVVVAGPLISWWAGPQVDPSRLLLAALLMYVVAVGLSQPCAMYFNGIGAVGFQAATAACMAGANLPLSIWLAHRAGVAGPLLATTVCQVLLVLVPSAIFLIRNFSDLGNSQREEGNTRVGSA